MRQKARHDPRLDSGHRLATRSDRRRPTGRRHRIRRAPRDRHRSRAVLVRLRAIIDLVPEGPAFEITTADVDDETKVVAGSQLVVPVTNARYVLNGANARWGSLYDALYGTDALGDLPPGGPYDAERGAHVIAWARALLDDAVPLASGSHADVVAYRVVAGALVAAFNGEATSPLREPSAFTGHRGDAANPSGVLLTDHGLRIEIVIDRPQSVCGLRRTAHRSSCADDPSSSPETSATS